ncbi:MAG TPA: hypothetical protein VNZ59_20820, partial [Burkholderiales bacterium]|nr:hypothetical protein [Burkholderiales bacterium]
VGCFIVGAMNAHDGLTHGLVDTEGGAPSVGLHRAHNRNDSRMTLVLHCAQRLFDWCANW